MRTSGKGPQRLLLPLVAAGAMLLVLGAAATAFAASRQPTAVTQTPAASHGCVSRFSVVPTSGPVGTQVTISGTGWPSNRQVGLYFVDSARHLRPNNLAHVGVAKNGIWNATVTIPSTVVFHAVGDETTNAKATQTISQPVGAGSYLIYAAASDSPKYSISSVCPVTFTVTPQGAAGQSGALSTVGTLDGGPPFGLFFSLAALLAVALTLYITRHRSGSIPARAGAIALLALALLGGSNFLLLAPNSAHAQATGVTPAVGGTTLFSDDFESDTVGALPAGWTVEAGSNWSVQVDGSQVLAQTSSSSSTLYGITAGNPTWTDYTLSASVKPGPGSTTSGTSVVAIDGRKQDVNDFYSLLVKNGNLWYLGKKINGNWTTLANGTMSYTTTTWYTWTLSMTGTTISASINGTTLATAHDSTFSAGYIGLTTRNQSEFDNIVVTSNSSATPTPTPTNTATPTPTSTTTATPTPTNTPTATPTNTPTATPTNTPTPTPTPTNTPTPTPTPTNTPTPTPTATNTPTPTPTNTATATATPTNTPTGYGSIAGQVTDSSGLPLAGAQITTSPATVTATSDSSGSYTLTNVPAGTYAVVASLSGYNANYTAGVAVTDSNTTSAATMALTSVPPSTSMDTFVQPDQPGWNPSSDGNSWLDDSVVYPGATTSIASNRGYADTYTAATDRDEWMGQNYGDQQVSADFEVLQYGQDAYQHGARLLGRVNGNNTFIDFAINYATSTLQIWVNNKNNWIMMNQVSVAPFQTGIWYHAKLLTVGTMAYGKVWAFGAAEPSWQIYGSQTALTTGMGGTRSTFCDIYWSNFVTQAVTTITGTVKNSSGSAIAGATVSDGTNSATTDKNGRYVLIEPNSSATYTITASASGYTTQSQSVTTTSLTSTAANFTMS